jgi:glycosyltransferase involved in cell wall biosynthesis
MKPAKRPLITIGMPTYARTTYIRAALDSCFAQTFADFEIIVHDDTQDNSIRAIVESYNDPRVRYIQNNPMLGLVAKLNDFLFQSRGDWLVILCDDDLFEPGYLQELVRMSHEHPAATLLRTRNRLIDEAGRELTLDNNWPEVLDSSSFLERLFLPHDGNIAMNLTGMMFRPEQLKSLGGFADLYRGWHVDRIAWALLGAQGEVISSHDVLCNIRIFSGSISSGLIPDFEKSLESDLTMKTIIGQLIDTQAALATSEAERDRLRSANRIFGEYLRRHMSRSLDHGLLMALANPAPNKQSDPLKLLAKHNIPAFSTSRAYRLLRHFPLWIRKAAVQQIYKYKQGWLKRSSRKRRFGM